MTANRAHSAENLRPPKGESNRLDANELVPEADLLEQLTPVDPAANSDFASAAGGPTSAVRASADEPNAPVDEADWLEQQLAVPAAEGDDEDYPPD